MENSKCIIDNWSLESAGALLDDVEDINAIPVEKFESILGGLSNYINAILLYDDISFLENGFENHWTRFEWFKRNTKAFIKPKDPSILSIDWHSKASYDNNGINNYLITAEVFETDLFISPERAGLIKQNPTVNSNFITTLKKLEDLVNQMKEDSWYQNTRIGIENNFILPSLTHYVLSQATNKEDLLTVIMQLKSDGKIDRIKKEIEALTNNSAKSSMKFQKSIESIVNHAFGLKTNDSQTWSIKVSALFLSLSKSFNLNIFNKKEHIVFLKDLAAIRTENNKLKKDIERIFNRVI